MFLSSSLGNKAKVTASRLKGVAAYPTSPGVQLEVDRVRACSRSHLDAFALCPGSASLGGGHLPCPASFRRGHSRVSACFVSSGTGMDKISVPWYQPQAFEIFFIVTLHWGHFHMRSQNFCTWPSQ